MEWSIIRIVRIEDLLQYIRVGLMGSVLLVHNNVIAGIGGHVIAGIGGHVIAGIGAQQELHHRGST